MTDTALETTGERAPERPKRALGDVGATVFGLCGLAVAQPLLLLLGPAVTFFTAHGVGRSDVLLFTAVVLLGPPSVVLLLLLIVRVSTPRLVDPVAHVAVGALMAAVLVPTIDNALKLHPLLFGFVAIGVAVAVARLHQRRTEVRSFLRLTAVVPPLIVVWFLFFSSVASLVLPQAAIATARAAKKSNVLLVIFDEFPLAAVMSPDGAINDQRFPGIAALSRTSTWYRHATTVAPWTNLAVPAIMSGRNPSTDPPSDYYARNIFSMLKPTHDLVGMEYVTRLCRGRGCDAEAHRARLYDDARVLYLHSVLPQKAAAAWLPPVGDRWANFQDRSKIAPGRARGTETDQAGRFDRLVQRLRPGPSGKPKAWVGHFILPHLPLKYLPDGRVYDLGRTYGLTPKESEWLPREATIDIARQRFVLQMRYTDRVITNALQALKDNGLYDDTLVVITADHGLSFQAGDRRGVPYTEQQAPEILPVPLFVKYPGQKTGQIVDRPVQVTDIMPTIAESLAVDLPSEWTFDGLPLQEIDERPERPPVYIDGGRRKVQPPAVIEPTTALGPYRELFGDWRAERDTYGWGPHWQLQRAKIGTLDVAESDLTARLVTPGITSFDPNAVVTPALVDLRFDRRPPGDWFAVAVNGTIAGLGRAFADSGEHKGMAMIDPALLRAGTNAVEGISIDASGRLARFRMAP